ncbi:MAG: hypothetical protein OXL96_28165 [Candidatus Poribacteria bacterium]|nr:hypothetical protein [Candidatus Poribacteria bacterium]
MNKLPSDYFYEQGSIKTSKTYMGNCFENCENWGYLYDILISSLLFFKGTPLNVLEIGVSLFGEKSSAHAFSKMPYVGQYVGVDVQPLVGELENNHVFIRENSDTYECLNKVQPYAPFDLMIHDGDHTPPSQTFFLKEYRSLLNLPGIMVVENIIDDSVGNMIAADLRDESIHFINVPPRRNWGQRGILKVNF